MSDSGSTTTSVVMFVLLVAGLGLLVGFAVVTARRLPPLGSSAASRLKKPVGTVYATAVALGAASLVLLLYALPRQPRWEPAALLALAMGLYGATLTGGAANAALLAEARSSTVDEGAAAAFRA